MFSSGLAPLSRIAKLVALIAVTLVWAASTPVTAERYIWTDWVKNIQPAKSTTVDGYFGRVAGGEIKPHRILQILQSKTKNEFCKFERILTTSVWSCKYTYKIVIQRPENDINHGSRGELPVLGPLTGAVDRGYKYKLEYVVGHKRAGELSFTRLKVRKAPYPGDRTKLILHIEEGFDPGQYPLYVALYVNRVTIPDGVSVNSDKVIDRLMQFLGIIDPVPGKRDVFHAMLSESDLIELFKRAATARLIVSGRVPNITGLKKNDADVELRARALDPNPRPEETTQSNLVGKVIRQGKAPGRYMPIANAEDIDAARRVPYVYGVAPATGNDSGTLSDVGPADCCIGGFDGSFQCLEDMKKNRPWLYNECKKLGFH